MSANYITSSNLKTILHSEFQPNGEALIVIDRARYEIVQVVNSSLLMQAEVKLSKALYIMVRQTVGYGDFSWTKRDGGIDSTNCYHDQGYYLSCGPYWRVFDLADLIKNALVMLQMLIVAMTGENRLLCCQHGISLFQQFGTRDVIFTALQKITQLLVKDA